MIYSIQRSNEHVYSLERDVCDSACHGALESCEYQNSCVFITMLLVQNRLFLYISGHSCIKASAVLSFNLLGCVFYNVKRSCIIYKITLYIYKKNLSLNEICFLEYSSFTFILLQHLHFGEK